MVLELGLGAGVRVLLGFSSSVNHRLFKPGVLDAVVELPHYFQCLLSPFAPVPGWSRRSSPTAWWWTSRTGRRAAWSPAAPCRRATTTRTSRRTPTPSGPRCAPVLFLCLRGVRVFLLWESLPLSPSHAPTPAGKSLFVHKLQLSSTISKMLHIYSFKFDPLLRNPPGVYGIRFGVGQLKGFYKWGGVMIQGVVGQNLTPQNDPKAL